jgi:hypothetical protein
MTVFTTTKGRRRARPWWLIRPVLLPLRYTSVVTFTQNCKYSLPGEDWMDANKLLGVRLLTWKKNSFRIGWRWNPYDECIELCAYRYTDGERFIYWFPVKFNRYENIVITLAFSEPGEVDVFIANKIATRFKFNWTKRSRLGLKHNVFFGGNNPAPQDVSIYITTLN